MYVCEVPKLVSGWIARPNAVVALLEQCWIQVLALDRSCTKTAIALCIDYGLVTGTSRRELSGKTRELIPL